MGAFNVYNLEGIIAVVRAAEENNSPAIIQFNAKSLNYFGSPIIQAAKGACKESTALLSIHLDHCSSKKDILYML